MNGLHIVWRNPNAPSPQPRPRVERVAWFARGWKYAVRLASQGKDVQVWTITFGSLSAA